MTRTDIFTSLEDFSRYAPGLSAGTDYRQLEPHIRIITSEIFRLITPASYLALRHGPEPDTEESVADAMTEGLELLKTAVASGTLYKYQIFLTTERAGSDSSLYKYQHEELKRAHLDSYWTALDELLEWLYANPGIGDFSESAIYKEKQMLLVKSADEFDRYFQIDRSAYFFSRVQYILRDTTARVRKLIDEDDEEMLELAKKSVCYRTMAKVVMTFDVAEWPKCIRYDFNHEYSKGSDIQDRRTLHYQFLAEAESAEEMISTIQSRKSGITSIENMNSEESKHYTML